MELTAESQFATLDRSIPNDDDYALAVRHAPTIRFDAREPFLPLAVGYTVFRQNGESPSFPREIMLPDRAACAVEYAIWWDWDIQHLYELEHLWVYLDAAERVIAAEASWHGEYRPLVDSSGEVPLEDRRVVVFSEPGKHAFAPVIDWLIAQKEATLTDCGVHSGSANILVTPLFEGIIQARSPLNNNVVHAHLERQAFTPAYDFSQHFALAQAALVPWAQLFGWIPARVQWWADHLRETTPPDGRRPLRIAHRGASAYAQEGSSASVEKAAQLRADMIEVDVRVTADDVPVIAHDANLLRVFGVEGSISELRFDELTSLTPPTHQPILSFEQMTDLCASLDLGLYLDIKEVTPTAMAQVIAILRRRGMLAYCIFGSFRPDVIAEIKANAPDAQTSILFASTHVDPVALAAAVGADYVHPCWERFESPSALLAGTWMERVRAANLGVVCWHEERPSEIAALNTLGVDGICSDQPELLVRGSLHAPKR